MPVARQYLESQCPSPLVQACAAVRELVSFTGNNNLNGVLTSASGLLTVSASRKELPSSNCLLIANVVFVYLNLNLCGVCFLELEL